MPGRPEKIGGLWFQDDRLVVDPVITACAEYIKAHPEEMFERALKHNALLQGLMKNDGGKN